MREETVDAANYIMAAIERHLEGVAFDAEKLRIDIIKTIDFSFPEGASNVISFPQNCKHLWVVTELSSVPFCKHCSLPQYKI